MVQSTNKGFSYPQYTDTPDVPRDIYALASNIDAYLTTNKGPQGTQGTQGTQGLQGIQGVQGTQGLQGAQGVKGIGLDLVFTNSSEISSGSKVFNITSTMFANLPYALSSRVTAVDISNTANTMSGIITGIIASGDGQSINVSILVDQFYQVASPSGNWHIYPSGGLQGIQGASIQGARGIQGPVGPVGASNAHESCRFATTDILPNSPIYTDGTTDLNGGKGIGATLTATTYGALIVDGVNLTGLGNLRILVKNQANAIQNGIYDVTSIGSSSTYWSMTRSVDYNDSSASNAVSVGDFTFVYDGVSLRTTTWMMNNQAATGLSTKIGTDPITFVRIDGVGAQGVQGTQGVQGNQGNQGVQGLQGLQGLQGGGFNQAQGTQGVQGIQGIQGIQGNLGIQGSFGLGFNSVWSGINLPGPGVHQFSIDQVNSPNPFVVGEWVYVVSTDNAAYMIGQVANSYSQSNQIWFTVNNPSIYSGTQKSSWYVFPYSGTQGIQGPQGTQGIQGLGYAQLQGGIGQTGFQGIQGMQGLQGGGYNQLQGTQGLQGISGAYAAQGIQGIQGGGYNQLQGTQGLQGISGAYAAQGIQGIQGSAGSGGGSTVISSGKNFVLNSNMEIAQRGSSIEFSSSTNNNGYSLDRWYLYTGYSNTDVLVSQVPTGVSNQSPTPNQYAARIQRVSGNTSTAAINFSQTIPYLETLEMSGGYYTLSFYARSGSSFSALNNTLTCSVVSGESAIKSMFSFTTPTTLATQSNTLNFVWQRFTMTVPRSSIGSLGINFYYQPTGTADVSDYFEITGVMLESGTTATIYSRCFPSYQSELQECSRYYNILGGKTTNSSGPYLSSMGVILNSRQAKFVCPINMIQPPTSISYSNGASNKVSVFDFTLNTIFVSANYSIILNSASSQNAELIWSNPTSIGFTTGDVAYLYGQSGTTPPPYITFDSELY